MYAPNPRDVIAASPVAGSSMGHTLRRLRYWLIRKLAGSSGVIIVAPSAELSGQLTVSPIDGTTVSNVRFREYTTGTTMQFKERNPDGPQEEALEGSR